MTTERTESLIRLGARKNRLPRAITAIALGKPRIVALVGFTTLAGYVAAGGSATHNPLHGALLIIGTMLAAAGANALNQVVEAREDAAMSRTASRPIPSGAIDARTALLGGSLATLVGVLLLYMFINPLTALLALLTTAIYIVVYTPLKRITPFSMIAGAVSGAIPPMMGWTGTTGELGVGSWTFFLVVFIWQIPHFVALSHIHRDDYAAAGFKTLVSCGDAATSSRFIALNYALALIPASLMPVLSGAGLLYAAGALLLSPVLLVPAVKFLSTDDRKAARRLFFATISYLFLLMVLVIADAFIQ